MPETAPTLETPPGAPPPPMPEDPNPGLMPAARVRTARFGELDHTEVARLLDSLDNERERARFRESVYISLFVWMAIAWFAIYGPRVLFHQGRIVSPTASEKHNTSEMATLDLPKSLVHTPRPTRTPAVPAPALAPTPQPPAARRPTPPPQPAQQQQQRPAPQQAQPQPAPPTPQQSRPQPPQNLPQTPQPRPLPPSIPDAPRPTQQVQNRPSFTTPGTAGQSIADATRMPSRPGFGDNAELGSAPRGSRGGPIAGSGAELLSDPQGVDFDPYIKRILSMIRANWIPLIPEECNPPISKAGTTLIRLKIEKDGTITANGMKLEDSTHDDAINKAAWGGITSVGQFPPLPKQYPGSQIELRIRFEIIQRQQR